MDVAKMESMKQAFQTEANAYKQLQADVAKNHTARQQFIQQQQENDMVLKELEMLEEDANVYKLIGPALVKQDPVEAKSNVSKRLEFIRGELGRLDSQLKNYEEKQQKKGQQLAKMQTDIQALTQSAASAVAQA
ncbi:hypothetical protein WJX72_006190 [[Myrmecia] bisecta]|uniref:Prefoldin subunit 6 n=1 Tax=[Myrmecia] bisecta TaxID=41462 RepID=A0AAW1QR04_9CHLO